MKLSAQIQFRPKSEIIERFSNEKSLLSILKGLFIKKIVTIHEENFNAPELLSRLNLAFKSSGITNLIRVSHDDTEFYFDKNNEQDDLDKIIDEFSSVLRNAFEKFYEKIAIIMEIKHEGIDFMIELNLLRIHPIGEFPVQLNITGLPEASDVKNFDQKFKIFINKLELNICKYVEIYDISQNIIKKQLHEITNNPQIEEKQSEGKCVFFPLYGVTLGETKLTELAKNGVQANDYDSEKKRYKYYTVKDMRFWHNDEIANHIYLTYSDPLPEKWRKCGLSWDLSFNDWVGLLKKLEFSISIVNEPKKEWYNGQQTLYAEFHASKKIKKDIILSIEVYFNYSQKSSVMSKGTVYSLRFRV